MCSFRRERAFYCFAFLTTLVISFSVSFSPPNRSRHSAPFFVKMVQRNTTARRSGKDLTEKEKIEMKTWNPLRLLVLKLGVTEPVYSSPLNYEKRDGTYSCAYCGTTLFDSNGKYDSRSGWPSFWRSERDGVIDYKKELDGRVEILCKRCNSHLGHVFPDGPKRSDYSEELISIPESDPDTPERLPRFCVNGAALKFNERE